MKLSACIFVLLLAVRASGGDLRSFENFKAPNVTGAYNETWSPLGPTVEGFNFGVGFYLQDGGESSPAHFWISKKTKNMVEVNSIAAVNLVIGDLRFKGDKTSLQAIYSASKMYQAHISASGPSALPLSFEDPGDLARVVLRLRNAGLDASTADTLLSLGNSASRKLNQSENKWTAVWYEIDKLGGIERVSVAGSVEPFAVASVLHEVVFQAGKVRPDILLRSNFFDLSLSRG